MITLGLNDKWISYSEYRAGAAHAVTGTIVVWPGVHSPQLNNTRDLLVYLPPGYESGHQRYPVLYMQDGQNLYDHTTAFGGCEWCVDETLDKLSLEGLQAIVVGLPHAGENRITEYNPFPNLHGGTGELYLEYVVDTVKPLIDAELRTRPGRSHTGLFGSSMGGLISLYGFFSRPRVFGLAGAMSPALWFTRGEIYDYVAQAPRPSGRIYLDNGTRENSARQMANLLEKHGYIADKDFMYLAEEGAQHTEEAWARRLPGALRFLLG